MLIRALDGQTSSQTTKSAESGGAEWEQQCQVQQLGGLIMQSSTPYAVQQELNAQDLVAWLLWATCLEEVLAARACWGMVG